MRILLVTLVIAAALTAAEPNPFAGNARAEKAGAKLFKRECSECHGATAEGIGKAPSLRLLVTQTSPATLFLILNNGKIMHGMPSFAHLPEPQRWQIVTYLQSLNSKPAN
jgi:mono/diheme cytochrome c family protein